MRFIFRTGDTRKPHIKRMIAARNRAIAAGMRLLTEDEILEEAGEQGRIMGRREMKPLIRELIGALEDFQLEHSYNSKKEALVARAKEVLEND